MSKKVIWGLGLGALAAALVVAVYSFYSRPPEPVPPAEQAVPPAAVSPLEKPGVVAGKLETPPAVPETAAKAEPAPSAPAPGPEAGPAPPEEKIFAPLTGKEQYGVLVGRYENYRQASKVLAKLRKQGKPAYIRPDPEKPTAYQVWVAPLPTLTQAEAAAKSIKTKLRVSPKIQKIEVLPPK